MTHLEELRQRVLARLATWEAMGLKRSLHPPSGIDLSSNDYLGLAAHPRLVRRMVEAVQTYGCGATASRLLRGHRQIFTDVERRFAAFKGGEAALYFASGYAANLGVLTTFLESDDVVFSDERNHASLIDGMRLTRARRVIFPHRDVDALAHLLRSEQGPGQKFLVTESLFSMDGDRAPLQDYAALCRETGTALIVDEAHAVGIYGERGSGLIEEMGVDDAVFLSINTAGKALGVCGAFVVGPAWAIEYLIQRARSFVFSTAPPPALAAALDEALRLIAEEPGRRMRVRANALRFREQLMAKGIAIPLEDSPIIPVILGESARAVAVAAALQEEGFDVRAIRPPTVPAGTARLRISVNVGVDEAIAERFASALARILRSG
ncbi:MAG: 8-amino-7-oxononanoate synthase [Acidobacteriota bacterium]|nr:8-amino-7-oxononanoate synthase [Acidobacteriota bacterium]